MEIFNISIRQLMSNADKQGISRFVSCYGITTFAKVDTERNSDIRLKRRTMNQEKIGAFLKELRKEKKSDTGAAGGTICRNR